MTIHHNPLERSNKQRLSVQKALLRKDCYRFCTQLKCLQTLVSRYTVRGEKPVEDINDSFSYSTECSVMMLISFYIEMLSVKSAIVLSFV